jgi:HNH endonuclease
VRSFVRLKWLVQSVRKANRTETGRCTGPPDAPMKAEVLIPDEIEACRKFRAERTATEPKPEVPAADIDFYNVRENRIKVYERDAYKCRYCEKQLTRFTATLDHVMPVVEGGDNGFGNLVTACLGCNSRKHKRPVGDFLVEQ